MKYFKQMSMFMLMLLCSMTSLAYDFEVDGIYYNIIDLDSKTVAVTHNGKNKKTFTIDIGSYLSPHYVELTYYADTYVGEIFIPKKVSYRGREFTVTAIGEAAFLHQGKLTKISIPSSIQWIEILRNIGGWKVGAFFGCDFQTVQAGNSVCLSALTVGYEKSGSEDNPKTKIKELYLSSDFADSITTDFSSWSSLNKIISHAATPPKVTEKYLFSNQQYVNLPVYVPEGSIEEYQQANVWKDFFELKPIKKVTSISLDKVELNIGPKDKVQLHAQVLPEDAFKKDLIWTSNNENVATVDANGIVIPVGKGEAIITAKTTDESNLSATCNVRVDCLVNSIKLNPKSLILEPNQTAQLSATVLPNEAYIKDLKWKSLDESVASVDTNGKITANSVGKTKVIASTTDGSELSDTCKINVVNLSSVKVGDLYYKYNNEGTGGAVVIANPDGTSYQGSVVIPESIKIEDIGTVPVISIGTGAFANANGLTKIAIPTSVKSIDEKAFTGCSSLEYVGIANGSKLSANLDVIFADSKLLELYLGSDSVSFNENSKLLSGLKSIVVGNTVSTLPDVAVCNNTLERFIVEDGTTAILEPENYCKKIYKQVYSKCVKDLGLKSGIYSLFYQFGYAVNVVHLKPLADLIDSKTIKYIYFGREVDCSEVEKPTYKIAPTIAGSRYKELGYMDEYNYTYYDYITNTDYKESELTAIKLNKDMAILKIGEQLQLSVINEPSSVPSTNVIKWSSSNEGVATVDVFGNVKMVGKGEAIITAETLDGSKLSASCTIKDQNSGIEDIVSDTDSGYIVYNLNGIRVLKTANKSDLESLPKGVYIVNNKKVAIY